MAAAMGYSLSPRHNNNNNNNNNNNKNNNFLFTSRQHSDGIDSNSTSSGLKRERALNSIGGLNRGITDISNVSHASNGSGHLNLNQSDLNSGSGGSTGGSGSGGAGAGRGGLGAGGGVLQSGHLRIPASTTNLAVNPTTTISIGDMKEEVSFDSTIALHDGQTGRDREREAFINMENSRSLPDSISGSAASS